MKKSLLFVALALSLFSCKFFQKTNKPVGSDDGKIEVVFLQMNDVYEISPLEGGQAGGLARVASLRKKLLAENPNTITVLAGDFISPSVTSTLKYDGQRIRGRHMVECLNMLGLDFVCFGNHEFDYTLPDLQARIDESKFQWISGNVRQNNPEAIKVPYKSTGEMSPKCPISATVDLKDADGTTLKIGIFAATLDAAKKDFVFYEDWKTFATAEAARLKTGTDLVVGLTHLFEKQDAELAENVPFCPLIMGGHDHNNMRFEVNKTVVAKADANAKTVYVHRVFFDKKSKKATVKSTLVKIDGGLPDDPETGKIVKKWEDIAQNSFKSNGFEPSEHVTLLAEPLDCREGVTRIQQMPIGKELTNAMISVSREKPEVAIFNSGSMRLDDFLRGQVTQLDVLRLLPFGGGFWEVEMSGNMLRRTLTGGNANRGRGGFLQTSGAEYFEKEMNWKVGGQFIDNAKNYRVVIAEFLLTGGESGLEFLKSDGNLDIKVLSKPDPNDKQDLRNDIRLALIQYWSV